MRVSQRLDYALRAVVLLAARRPGDLVSGTEIAMRLGLPQRVVEQQLSALARAGVLTSRPGAGGGHALARPAALTTAAEVVRAIQGGVLDVPRMQGSAVAELWNDADRVLEEHLGGITIADLARRQAEMDSAAAGHYSI